MKTKKKKLSERRKKHTIERKMQISKVDEICCVLRYNIWQIEHTSKTILKHVVYGVPIASTSSSFGIQYTIDLRWLHTVACVDYIQK